MSTFTVCHPASVLVSLRLVRIRISKSQLRSILFTVNGPKPIKLRRHHEVLKAQLIGKTISLISHSRWRIDQSAIIIKIFSTGCERRIRPFVNTTTYQSPIDARSQRYQRSAHPATAVSQRSPRLSHTFHSLLSVCIRRKWPMSKHVGYCLRYSSTENGSGVMIEAS